MTFAVTATVVAVTSVASIGLNAKSRSEQKKASRKQQKVSEAQTARERMAQVRQARIAQSQIVQGGATQGVMTGSAVQGGYSAVGALSSGNIGFMNAMENLNQGIARDLENSAKYQGYAQTATALGNLALTGMSMSGPATPSQAGATPNANVNAQMAGSGAFSGNFPRT